MKLIANGFVLSLLLVAACHNNGPVGTANTTGAQVPPPPSPASETAPNAARTPTAAHPTGIVENGTQLESGQILEVVHTANDAEIAQAKLALEKSRDRRIRDYADRMVTDHTQADTKGREVARKENLQLAASPLSATDKSRGDQTLDELRTKTGKDFDRAYIDAQVKEHQSLLDTINDRLSAGANDPNVKSYVESVRSEVENHLRHAKQIQSELAK